MPHFDFFNIPIIINKIPISAIQLTEKISEANILWDEAPTNIMLKMIKQIPKKINNRRKVFLLFKMIKLLI